MNITEQQRAEFEAVTRPVIEWLNKNCHPHVTVVVEPTSAELMEGMCAVRTNDYVPEVTMKPDRPSGQVDDFQEKLSDQKNMLRYFWREKGDLERFSGYDEAFMREHLPHVWMAWHQYKLALRALDAIMEDL